jgi:hypothetical protein
MFVRLAGSVDADGQTTRAVFEDQIRALRSASIRLRTMCTDGASALDAAFAAYVVHEWCVLHRLHLVATSFMEGRKQCIEDVKRIVASVRSSTRVRNDVRDRVWAELGIPLDLVVDNDTRWGSTYAMLSRFVACSSALADAGCDVDPSAVYHSSVLIRILKPINELVDILQARNRPASADVLYLVHRARAQLSSMGLQSSDLLRAFDQTIYAREFYGLDSTIGVPQDSRDKRIISRYGVSIAAIAAWANINIRGWLRRTIGDAGIKKCKTAFTILLREELAVGSLPRDDVLSGASVVPGDATATFFDQQVDLIDLDLEKAAGDTYREPYCLDVAADRRLLGVWKNIVDKQPPTFHSHVLAAISTLFAHQVTSAASESLFSTAGAVQQGRAALAPERLSDITYIKSNMPIVAQVCAERGLPLTKTVLDLAEKRLAELSNASASSATASAVDVPPL